MNERTMDSLRDSSVNLVVSFTATGSWCGQVVRVADAVWGSKEDDWSSRQGGRRILVRT